MPRLSFLNGENVNIHSTQSILFHLGGIAIRNSLPGLSVRKFLLEQKPKGRILLLSIGKAAEEMASAAYEILQSQIFGGIILTKYGYTSGKKFPPLEILEAGHPIPDTNSLLGGKKILELCSSLQKDDIVLILLSGGGSALTEVPEPGLNLEDLIAWNSKLLSCGADIQEINSVRTLLSSLKGGGLLTNILPSKSITLILSDVIGDDLSKVASGPTIPSEIDKDSILRIFKQYDLSLDPKLEAVLYKKTEGSVKSSNQKIKPKNFSAEHKIDPNKNSVHCIGNITQALEAVQRECINLNIPVLLLTSSLNCEAKEAGFFLGEIAKENLKNKNFPLLILCGGETTVTHDGSGKGGRNQELALSFSKRISGCQGITLFSLATDGSDGPTDAAGAIVDGNTWKKIYKTNDANLALKTHNSYEVLDQVDSLVFTGVTGTNVNDIQFLLITAP
ncbi:glycerate kinase type-2 family protein [Leptospira kirschneri]|uniref:glycerate kinase type-2 family protein n=1 Tax=Leptospira kirschneri TaxID=29507 RepID=UPI0002976046|nr:glycerate kinase [Leptospira kirschneri]EKQ82270.1 MOFRL family protein [Leptospira kirschneri serovar Grippotyphosa str. Moskva]EKR06939.1 MOFRL family protein [Leptospira kirschneri serovar Valbuzzi str. 200702274]OOV48556.1 glycerate kinase [Leptospira kirschneri serovar Grippotyphosa]UZW37333.1 glycerate kinase [Leptospira kirschneri]WHP01026.1 glycerate kinase [Leptospira kirschneri]